jgi:hypothetical protein
VCNEDRVVLIIPASRCLLGTLRELALQSSWGPGHLPSRLKCRETGGLPRLLTQHLWLGLSTRSYWTVTGPSGKPCREKMLEGHLLRAVPSLWSCPQSRQFPKHADLSDLYPVQVQPPSRPCCVYFLPLSPGDKNLWATVTPMPLSPDLPCSGKVGWQKVIGAWTWMSFCQRGKKKSVTLFKACEVVLDSLKILQGKSPVYFQ